MKTAENPRGGEEQLQFGRCHPWKFCGVSLDSNLAFRYARIYSIDDYILIRGRMKIICMFINYVYAQKVLDNKSDILVGQGTCHHVTVARHIYILLHCTV